MMRDERGVTMVEVLAAISLTGIIAAALTFAIVTGLRTTDQTRDTILEAQDAQLTGTAFVSDVQSADEVSTSDTSCAGADPIVHLGWTDQGSAIEVAYAPRTVDGERLLTRYECVDGGSARTRDVARVLDPSTDPTVSCSPACDATAESIEMIVTQASGQTFRATAGRRAG